MSQREARVSGMTRRGVLKSAAAAAAAGPFVARLAAAVPVKAAAAPIKLVFQPWYNFSNATTPAGIALMHQGLNPWLAKNPGVQVEIVTLGYQGTMRVALLAGQGPDVFADWVLPPYVSQNLVYDFAPLARRDNVDLGIFPGGEMAYFEEVGNFGRRPGALYAMPSYLHLTAPAVNLGILNELGLAQPEPGWTYKEWTKLWTETAVLSAAKRRYGGSFDWDGYDYAGDCPSAFYLVGFGGGYVNPNDPTKSYLNAPQTIEAMTWIYDLVQSGVMNGGNFATGTQATANIDTAGGLIGAASNWRSLDWQIFPEPLYPKQRVAYAASDFYAINAGTKQPELAWSLLKYLCTEKPWQQHMMKIAMAGPNQKGLWEQYAYELQAVAPPLRGKNLLVYNDQVQNNEPTFGLAFRYAEAQATAVIIEYSNLVQARKMTWAEAGPAASKQINAAEALGPSEAAAAAAQTSGFLALLKKARTTKSSFAVAAPPRTDFGTPATPASGLVTVKAGAFTVSGTGTGLTGSSDGGTFAAAPFAQSQGTFTCRLTGITAGKKNVPNQAKVGIMARSSLSSSAAYSAVLVALNGGSPGIHSEARPVPGGGGAKDTQGWNASQPTGLIGANVILSSRSKPAANYLTKPVWLKIVRDGATYTTYTSLDGKTWTQAGSPQTVEAIGLWVGLFVTSHSGPEISATFDNLSGFAAPHTFVQIG